MHFAEIDPVTNLVMRVIVADCQEWCESELGGVWLRTYYSTPGHTYAGVGYEYVPEFQNFRGPQPFPSWTFDVDTWQWNAPVPYPDEGVWAWDEITQQWVQ